MRKTRIWAVLLCLTLFGAMALGSGSTSNTVDYTGKVDATDDVTDEPDELAEGVKEEINGNESTENVDEMEEASYEISIISFDIEKSSFDDGYRYRGIVEVSNTGGRNIYIKNATFDIEDATGSLVQSDSMISCCPDVILPGEKGYLYNQFGSTLDGVTDIEGLQLVPQYVVKETNETPHEYETSDVSIKDDTFGVKVVGRVTNDTDEDESYMYIQAIYYDADGKVIGVTGTSITEFLAGRTVSFEISGIDLPQGLTISDIADYDIIARESFYGF